MMNKNNFNALDQDQGLYVQIIEVYKLWIRAMSGEYMLYFKYFAFTVDEHENKTGLRSLKPLISSQGDKEWLVPIIREIMERDYEVCHILKSRQMRMSWLLTHIHLYKGLVNPDWLILFLSTKRTNKADVLFDKLNKAYKRLPPWKMGMKTYITEGRAILKNETKFLMLGKDVDDPAGMTPNQGFFDEMGLNKNARHVYGILLPGLGIGQEGNRNSLVTNSTPRLVSFFNELTMDEFLEDTRTWIIKREWSNNGLSVGRNTRNHKIISLHYSADPAKDEGWRDREKPNYEPDVWEREFELNPDAIDGDKVYKRYDHAKMAKQGLKVNPNLPLIRGWDFGNRSAVVWYQYEAKTHTSRVLKELLHDYCDAGRLAQEVDGITKKLTEAGFNRYVIDYCDPFQGSQTNFLHGNGDTVMLEIEHIMQKYCNVHMKFGLTPRKKVPDSVEVVRAVMNQGFEIDIDECPLLVKGFRGGYAMKKLSDLPAKDGVYDHLMDALRYAITSIFMIVAGKGLVYYKDGLKQIAPYFEYKDNDYISTEDLAEMGVVVHAR